MSHASPVELSAADLLCGELVSYATKTAKPLLIVPAGCQSVPLVQKKWAPVIIADDSKRAAQGPGAFRALRSLLRLIEVAGLWDGEGQISKASMAEIKRAAGGVLFVMTEPRAAHEWAAFLTSHLKAGRLLMISDHPPRKLH